MIRLSGYVLPICSLLLFGCGETCNVLPNVGFRTSFSQGNLPQGYGYLDGGVCGIIVAQDLRGRFVAYDRCSTVSASERSSVVIVDNLTARDPNSGAEWYLFDGSPSKLAECPLRSYTVRQQGNVYYVEF